jgi:hypothetical protein
LVTKTLRGCIRECLENKEGWKGRWKGRGGKKEQKLLGANNARASNRGGRVATEVTVERNMEAKTWEIRSAWSGDVGLYSDVCVWVFVSRWRQGVTLRAGIRRHRLRRSQVPRRAHGTHYRKEVAYLIDLLCSPFLLLRHFIRQIIITQKINPFHPWSPLPYPSVCTRGLVHGVNKAGGVGDIERVRRVDSVDIGL